MKNSQSIVDSAIRTEVFSTLNVANIEGFQKINDRQYGAIIVAPPDGTHRYVRIPAIVAEERDDMTAEELMQSEIDAYNQKQADKAEKAKAKEKKIAKDKARREAEAKAKESEANA